MDERRHAGLKGTDSLSEIRRRFAQPDARYAPYQFWFWDQPLDDLGLKPEDMAHEMAEKGFNPGYAHARTNYAHEFARDGAQIPAISEEEWLGEKWFEAIDRTAAQARMDGVHFTVADEFGWPSLQAAGRVLKKYPEMGARSLNVRVFDVEGGAETELPPATFTVCARLTQTRSADYAEFLGGEWTRSHFSYDASHVGQTETLPYNYSAQWTRDGEAVFHPNLPGPGRYRLWARWSAEKPASERVEYALCADGQETVFFVDQRQNALKWNLLGAAMLPGGAAATVRLRNRGTGLMCADAIRLEREDDPDAYAVVDDLQTLRREIGVVDAPTLTLLSGAETRWRAPEGKWRVYSFEEVAMRGYDGSRVNNLDARLGERFAEIAYRPYFEKMVGRMGENREMNGIFADTEGGYGMKLAWSEDLAERFERRTGMDMRRMLPLMIDRAADGLEAKVRFEWYDAVSELFCENFAVPARLAQEHGMYYTMHTWEESLSFQANMVGDYFRLNRAVTLPGTDCLEDVAYNPSNFWDAASVCELEGRRCMAEMPALLGLSRYNMAELTRQLNALTAWGIGHVITHSVKMTRKYAQDFVPPDFYDVDPGWRTMRLWTDRARRCSYLNSLGTRVAEVLLVNPMDSIWALSDGANMLPEYDMWDVGGGIPAQTASHGGQASEINRVYQETIRLLARAGVGALTVDKFYINQMEVRKGRLVRGAQAFSTVILPPMTVMDRESARRLEQFAREGGNVLALGELPTGSPQMGREDAEVRGRMDALRALPNVRRVDDLEEMLRAGDAALRPEVRIDREVPELVTETREIHGRRWFWIANNSERAEAFTARLRCAPGAVSRWDPMDGSVAPVSARAVSDGVELSLRMEPCEGAFFTVDSEKEPESVFPTEWETLAELDSGWTARVDRGNRREALEVRFAPVRAGRLRVVLRKGSPRDPDHAHVERLVLCHGEDEVRVAEIRASSGANAGNLLRDGGEGWVNARSMALNDCAWLELRIAPEVTVDRLRIRTAEGEPLRDFRVEAFCGEGWRTLAHFRDCPQCELLRPTRVSDAILDCAAPVSLTDWREWNLLGENFSGSVDYECTLNLDGAILPKAKSAVPEKRADAGSCAEDGSENGFHKGNAEGEAANDGGKDARCAGFCAQDVQGEAVRHVFSGDGANGGTDVFCAACADDGFVLSLGEVGQIAEVWLNGKSLGARILPPFDFGADGALRPGENALRVRVSNSIASNAGAPEARCGLIGPVRLLRRKG